MFKIFFCHSILIFFALNNVLWLIFIYSLTSPFNHLSFDVNLSNRCEQCVIGVFIYMLMIVNHYENFLIYLSIFIWGLCFLSVVIWVAYVFGCVCVCGLCCKHMPVHNQKLMELPIGKSMGYFWLSIRAQSTVGSTFLNLWVWAL